MGFSKLNTGAHRCPCPTLHPPPHDDRRMARGQDGSLLLSCRTLSFPTTCRFIPALSDSLRRHFREIAQSSRQLRPLPAPRHFPVASQDAPPSNPIPASKPEPSRRGWACPAPACPPKPWRRRVPEPPSKSSFAPESTPHPRFPKPPVTPKVQFSLCSHFNHLGPICGPLSNGAAKPAAIL